ncbi:hypothetical protein CLV58_109218 [Spirosoma oryzae]|uniref:Uncharacterized protein n=1 Tax=Spirosoma oryzae TaxID=1469603 RepID=A0A2T0SYI1_9BACT|nr:hypothetical protein [Spirosoma oryzae]PRY38491.1 hypothetical protein CLV58_109218 [Spirosoma oryzae]
MEVQIERENYTSYEEQDYVVLVFGEQKLKTQFNPDHFLEVFDLTKVEHRFDRSWLPLINCTCGQFDCDGEYVEVIQYDTYLVLEGLLPVFDFDELELDQSAIKPFKQTMSLSDYDRMRTYLQSFHK